MVTEGGAGGTQVPSTNSTHGGARIVVCAG
jgi:hypothetical protein